VRDALADHSGDTRLLGRLILRMWERPVNEWQLRTSARTLEPNPCSGGIFERTRSPHFESCHRKSTPGSSISRK
jgi:hypothetical protein